MSVQILCKKLMTGSSPTHISKRLVQFSAASLQTKQPKDESKPKQKTPKSEAATSKSSLQQEVKMSSSATPSQASSSKAQSPPASPSKQPKEPSQHVFKSVKGKLGPGASKDSPYPNPEYFSYHKLSYYDMELEMKSSRLVQPSSVE